MVQGEEFQNRKGRDGGLTYMYVEISKNKTIVILKGLTKCPQLKITQKLMIQKAVAEGKHRIQTE